MDVQLLSTLSAVLGSMVVSLGLVLQKKGVSWLNRNIPKDKQYRRNRAIWILGFILNNTLVIFYFFALKALAPSVVGAMMGLNLVFTNIFSALILKEPIAKRVMAFSAMMILCIVVANLAAPETGDDPPVPVGLVTSFFLFPYAIVILASLLKRHARLSSGLYATSFATAAGCLEGVVIILVKAMQAERGDNILGYFTTPYLYMYLLATVSVISFMQIAYSHGKITRVAPALWGTQIAYPVLITYVAFGVPIVPLQLAAFFGIVICVIMIQTKH